MPQKSPTPAEFLVAVAAHEFACTIASPDVILEFALAGELLRTAIAYVGPPVENVHMSPQVILAAESLLAIATRKLVTHFRPHCNFMIPFFPAALHVVCDDKRALKQRRTPRAKQHTTCSRPHKSYIGNMSLIDILLKSHFTIFPKQNRYFKDIPAQWAKIRQGLDILRISSECACLSNGEV